MKGGRATFTPDYSKLIVWNELSKVHVYSNSWNTLELMHVYSASMTQPPQTDLTNKITISADSSKMII